MNFEDVSLIYVGEVTYNFTDSGTNRTVIVDKFLGIESDNTPFNAKLPEGDKPEKYQGILATGYVYSWGGKLKMNIDSWKSAPAKKF